MNVIPSKCQYPVVKHAILDSILCLGHSPEVGANQSESASLWTELRIQFGGPILCWGICWLILFSLWLQRRNSWCETGPLRAMYVICVICGSKWVVLWEELFDMLDVEEKGTLTQTEFADGLLHLLTPLGFLDTTNAGLGPFCPARWGFSQLTVPVVFC